jgi:hypothetical protein
MLLLLTQKLRRRWRTCIYTPVLVLPLPLSVVLLLTDDAFPPPPPMCHVASNPGPSTMESEVKRTCKYPVAEVYISLELTDGPDNLAISVGQLQHVELHRLMVTQSQPLSVSKEVNERRISDADLMSHLQFSPLL